MCACECVKGGGLAARLPDFPQAVGVRGLLPPVFAVTGSRDEASVGVAYACVCTTSSSDCFGSPFYRAALEHVCGFHAPVMSALYVAFGGRGFTKVASTSEVVTMSGAGVGSGAPKLGSSGTTRLVPWGDDRVV